MTMDIPSLSSGSQPGLLLSGSTSAKTQIVSEGNLDSISTIGGVEALGSFITNDSILTYVATQNNLLALFNQLIKNIESDTSINILKALGSLFTSIPSADQIQQQYTVSAAALGSGNSDINTLNAYNTDLNNNLSSIATNGGDINSDYNSVVSSNVSSTLTTQQADLQTLVTNFEAGYPNSMSLAQFQASLNTILSTSQTASDGEINTYNNAASSYATYASSVSDYNQLAANPTIAQSQYDNDQAVLENINFVNSTGGNIYPALDTMPDTTIGTTPIDPTQTTISSGAYSNVSFPNSNNYSFTTTSNNVTTVNTAALNQLLSDYGVSVTSAKNTDTGIQSTLSNFITTDYSNQVAQLPTSPFPILPTLTVPTLADFQNAVLQDVIANVVSAASTLSSQFGLNLSSTDTLNNPMIQDENQINDLVQQSNAASNLISLGSVGGVSVLNINGVTNATSLSSAYIIQQQTTNLANITIPNLSNQTQAYIASISNQLQSAYGAASVLGTLYGFKDAASSLGSSQSVNSSLVALNSLENYNSLIGSDYKGQLLQQAALYLPNATPAEQAAQASRAALPYAFASRTQVAVLGAQNVQNPAQFANFYLTSYGAAAIDAYVLKTGTLSAEQQQSVVKGQATLTNKLVADNVSFSSLNNNQVAVSNAFQSAAQQLQALGYTLSANDLANAQATFQGSLQGQTGPITATTLQQLLLEAISANIQNVPANVVANTVFLQFVQTEADYIVQVQNDFRSNRQINSTQAQQYSDRLTNDLFGESYNNSIQFVVNSDASNDTNFAEELANLTTNQEENLTQSQILEGTPQTVPGTDIMSNAVTAKNDVTPVPTEKRTAYIPI